jgi:MFS family permease
MFAWSILARMPVGMVPLALILLVRGEGGSFGEAGVVVASYALAVAVGSPYAGRRVDRRGPRGVLVLRGLVYPTCLLAAVALALADAPVLVLAPVAAAAGVSLPPVAATLRTLLTRLVGPDLLSTAYSVDAVLQEIFFIAGPLAVALLALLTPGAALVGAAAAAALGTLAFVRIGPVGAATPVERGHDRRFGAMGFAGMRTVVLLAVSWGLAFGAIEVATPAFAEQHGNRALAGVALAAFSAGSLVGGIFAGMRPVPDERRRLLVAAAALATCLALPIAATSIAAYCVLIFVAGLPIAPGVAAAYGLVGKVVVSGSHAEAFAWIGTAVSSGIAVGAAAGGWLVDGAGVRVALAAGSAAAAVGFVSCLLRRRTLRPLGAG